MRKEEKPDFLQHWDSVSGILRALTEAVYAAGGDAEDVWQLKTLAPQIAKMVVEDCATPVVVGETDIHLDTGLSLKEQIQKGKYGHECVSKLYTNGAVRLHRETGKRHLVLLEAKRSMTLAQMVGKAKQLGLSQPSWGIAVAVGYKGRKLITEDGLVFPTRSVVKDPHVGSSVPVLGKWHGEHVLTTEKSDYLFEAGWRFVFVRKDSQ